MSARAQVAAACLAVVGAGCGPDFGERASSIVRARILGVRATPAEVAPGQPLSLEALVAAPSGVQVGRLDWRFCGAPKPAAENNVVGAECLDKAVAALPGTSSPDGLSRATAMPLNACTLFGPDAPPPRPGEPPFRPRDPDITGGYYQPVRLTLPDGATAISLVRVRCNLVGATPELGRQYRAEYRDNQNPRLLKVEALLDGQPVAWSALPAGATLTLRAHWTGPQEARPSVEHFALFDRVQQQLVKQRESLRLSWFAAGGAFEQERTGLGLDEPEDRKESENRWTAPAEAGPVRFWFVLRDVRGGLDFLEQEAVVTVR